MRADRKGFEKKSKWLKECDCDEAVYLVPKFEGWYRSIYFRNCTMIDESDVIIFMQKIARIAAHTKPIDTP